MYTLLWETVLFSGRHCVVFEQWKMVVYSAQLEPVVFNGRQWCSMGECCSLEDCCSIRDSGDPLETLGDKRIQWETVGVV